MTTYKELITKLQILPRAIVPIAVYPSREGSYGTSRYYATAQNEAQVHSILEYLPLLDKWKRIAISSRENEELRRLSADICRNIGTNYGKVKAIHDWVFSNIDYMRTSSLITPDTLIKTRAGDCKSFTVLISTLLGIQGIPSWFKLVQMSGVEPRHIYNYVLTSWYPVDGTGYFCFSEVKRVIGYLLFEVDKTSSTPPRPLPSPVEAEEVPPAIAVEELGEILPLVGIGVLIALGLRKTKEV